MARKMKYARGGPVGSVGCPSSREPVVRVTMDVASPTA